MYDDAYTIQIVEEKEILAFNFVAGMVPFLFNLIQDVSVIVYKGPSELNCVSWLELKKTLENYREDLHDGLHAIPKECDHSICKALVNARVFSFLR